MRDIERIPFPISSQLSTLLRALAILGGLVSVCFTVRFCLELGGQGVALLPIMLGLFCEGLKFVAAGLGMSLLVSSHLSHRLTGWAALVLAVALMLASLAASLGYLVAHDADLRREALQQSTAYRSLRQRETTLSRAIDAKMAAAKQDTESGRFRGRGLRTLGEAEMLQKELEGISAELVELEHTTHATRDFFRGLATLIAPAAPKSDLNSATHGTPSMAASRVRVASYLAFAIILELGCVLLLHLLKLSHAMPQAYVTRPQISGPRRWRSAVTQASRGHHGKANQTYQRIKSAILEGRIAPAYRTVRPAFGLAQKTTTQIFRRLERDGIIERHGNGYRAALGAA